MVSSLSPCRYGPVRSRVYPCPWRSSHWCLFCITDELWWRPRELAKATGSPRRWSRWSRLQKPQVPTEGHCRQSGREGTKHAVAWGLRRTHLRPAARATPGCLLIFSDRHGARYGSNCRQRPRATSPRWATAFGTRGRDHAHRSPRGLVGDPFQLRPVRLSQSAVCYRQAPSLRLPRLLAG